MGAEDFARGMQLGGAFTDSFWSAFEKSRADYKDRRDRRGAQDRQAEINRVTKEFDSRAAILQEEINDFNRRKIKGPVSPEEEDAFDKRVVYDFTQIASQKMDYWTSLQLDENPYVAKLAERGMQQTMSAVDEFTKGINNSFEKAVAAKEARSVQGLREQQSKLTGAQTENLELQTEMEPGRFNLEQTKTKIAQQEADTSRINAGSQVRMAGVAEQEAATNSRNSFVTEDIKKAELEINKRRNELEAEGIKANSAKARAELFTLAISNPNLDDNQIDAMLKDTGLTSKDVRSRFEGLEEGAVEQIKRLEQLRDRRAAKAEKGDKQAQKDLDKVNKQLDDFSELLDSLQMGALDEAQDEMAWEQSGTRFQKYLRTVPPFGPAAFWVKKQLFDPPKPEDDEATE